ncbi:formate/nitrite transporter family protein [Oceanibacterium hippocampi]|uniref:Putative formate transporter 1 n=1 Tax=Oceanibacterium hippocampi TaxID=745714 RepID=A0A1Y5S7W8_9PROT|nr:formate/nitrite transporter family protein [Oceanibacterium hippocampi]SLN33114.1 putative formate transporter 1 [Oceanibacterium hippocampi]
MADNSGARQPATADGTLGLDAHKPAEMARLVTESGIVKARLPALTLFTLALLAGAFIAFGAMFYTVVITGSTIGFGPTRLLGGLAFSLGLVLVIVGGAELFTGNNLIAMAWADRRVTTAEMLRNWGIVYAGNFAGALGAALFLHLAGGLAAGDGAVAETAIRIAEGKAALGPVEAFFRGLLCNALVCLAVWLCFAARDVAGRIAAIIFPISAFVALGFEHSVANMYLLPIGMLAGANVGIGAATANLAIVTAGNIAGGALLVALVYWVVYLRGRGGSTRTTR